MNIKTKSRIDHLEVLLRGVREASRHNERTYRIRKYLGSFDAKGPQDTEGFTWRVSNGPRIRNRKQSPPIPSARRDHIKPTTTARTKTPIRSRFK